jgi:hypothetical protein
MAKRITNVEIPTGPRQKTPTAENPPVARNAPPIAEPTNPPMRLLAPITPTAMARDGPATYLRNQPTFPPGDGYEGYYPGQKSKNAHVWYVLKLLGKYDASSSIRILRDDST